MLSTGAGSPELQTELEVIKILVGHDSKAQAIGTIQDAERTGKKTVSQYELNDNNCYRTFSIPG
jgi:hypothetical protein